MAALESLSNKELRQKCIEFGMPNVPVTDSSRKILIRRLEAVMSGKPATTPNKTNRRETMHVSKPSEMASSAKITAAAVINNNNNNSTTSGKPTAANRPSRRTIAATERHVTTTTTVSEPEYSDVSPDRGEVITQMLPPKAKTPEKQTLYPKLPAKEPSPKPQVLSKTGVVSTSYVQESSINKTYAAPTIEDVDSTEDEIEEEITKPMASVPSYSSKSYVPLSESKVTTSASMPPLASTLSSSTRYSSLNSSYNYNSKPSSTTLSNISTSVRKNYEPPPTLRTSYQQPRAGSTQKYVTTPEPYDVEDDDDEEDMEDDDEDDVVLVEDSPIAKDDIQTPFLSQFARNLETLKATPIRHSIGPTKITPPKSSAMRQRETAAAYSRRTIGGGGGGSGGGATISARRSYMKNEPEESPFRQFVMALEEKYHLKQTFIIISIFIIAIFIYVFFIQSV
uniref:LEM domain protein n=1 Tax=Musca domestica TaxID=7370 RepID=T1PB76_MUSDO